MFNNPFYNNKALRLRSGRGISSVEIMVVTAVIALALSSLLGLTSFSLQQSQLANQTARATLLAKEQLEAARSFRDSAEWSLSLGSLTTGIAYHPALSASNPASWQMIAGAETIGIFSRTLVLTDGLRDAQGNIVESGGTADSNTKKLVSTVSWSERGKTHQVQLVTYLTNWK